MKKTIVLNFYSVEEVHNYLCAIDLEKSSIEDLMYGQSTAEKFKNYLQENGKLTPFEKTFLVNTFVAIGAALKIRGVINLGHLNEAERELFLEAYKKALAHDSTLCEEEMRLRMLSPKQLQEEIFLINDILLHNCRKLYLLKTEIDAR